MTPTDPLAADDAIVAEAWKRADAATDGPWAWTPIGEKVNGYLLGSACNLKGEPLSGRIADADDLVEPILIGEHEASVCNYADPDFIAHARTDIPALRAIADKRGRALREAMAEHKLDEDTDAEMQFALMCECGKTWPCPSLARIREILGGQE